MRASVACDGQVSDNPKQKLPFANGRFSASKNYEPSALAAHVFHGSEVETAAECSARTSQSTTYSCLIAAAGV